MAGNNGENKKQKEQARQTPVLDCLLAGDGWEVSKLQIDCQWNRRCEKTVVDDEFTHDYEAK